MAQGATAAILNAANRFSNGSAEASDRVTQHDYAGFCRFLTRNSWRKLSRRGRFATFLSGVAQRRMLVVARRAVRFEVRKTDRSFSTTVPGPKAPLRGYDATTSRRHDASVSERLNQ
jgi:hypothetical protein